MVSRLNFKLCALLFCASVAQAKHWDLFVDGLYWFASEETTNVWASVVGKSQPNVNFFKAQGLSFKPNGGVRAGLGYCAERNPWDVQLYTTWYQTHGCSSVPNTPNQLIETQFFAGFINGDIANSAQIFWKLKFNMYDGELGYNFVFGDHLVIRPFLGLRGGWINQPLTYSANNVVLFGPGGPFTSTESLLQKFWGIGPQFGANSLWTFAQSKIGSLSLFGDFSLATLWGHWSFCDKYANSTGQTFSVNLKDSTLGQLVLRGCAGFGWQGACTEKCDLTVQLGYELQWWVNQLRIPTFQQLPLHGDLTLQGGVFRCRFDF